MTCHVALIPLQEGVSATGKLVKGDQVLEGGLLKKGSLGCNGENAGGDG